MINKTRLVNSSLYAVAAAIFLAVLTVMYLALAPIDVIKDWSIVVPSGDHHVGDMMPVQSTYDKVRDATGSAHRYLECNTGRVSAIRYPLSEGEANHPRGKKTGTGIIVTIPNIATPATCRVVIDVDYQVYAFRTFSEHSASDPFNVVK